MSQLSPLAADPAPPRSVDPAFDVAIHGSLDQVEPIWRRLETAGILTPYQRFDWIAALLAAGAEQDSRIAVAVISQGQKPMAVLPMAIQRRWGTTQAHMLGSRQSNSDWIAADPGFAPSPGQLRALLGQIARAAGGIDVMLLQNQPAAWQGMANPVLALPHALAPSNLYATSIAGTPLPYVEHRLTTKRRSNINRGRRRLEELAGPVRLLRVRDAALLEQVYRVFIEQRGARFAEMGVDNIFAQPPFPQFFRQLASAGFHSDRPALIVHALHAGDEIVATSWGAMSGSHYSQYINSTSTGPAARYSLTGILVADLMDQLVSAGIETFDMGLGDFDYKFEWTQAQPVFQSILALTGKGKLAASAINRRDALKRLIKQTPRLWQAAKWLRLQKQRLVSR